MKKTILFVCLTTMLLMALLVTGGILVAANQPSLLSHLPATLSDSVNLDLRGIRVCPAAGATRTLSETAQVIEHKALVGSTTMNVTFTYAGDCSTPSIGLTCTPDNLDSPFSAVDTTKCVRSHAYGNGSSAKVTAEDDATYSAFGVNDQYMWIKVTADIYGNTWLSIHNANF